MPPTTDTDVAQISTETPSVLPVVARKFPLWAEILSIALGVVAILGGAFVMGKKYYHQVTPLTLATSTESGVKVVTTTVSSDSQFQKMLSSAIFNKEYCLSLITERMFDDEDIIALSTSTLISEGRQICTTLAEKGLSSIQFPVSISIEQGSSLNGSGIIMLGRPILVNFSINEEWQASSSATVFNFSLEHLKVLQASTVTSLTVISPDTVATGTKILQVKGSTSSGESVETYFGSTSRRHEPSVFSNLLVKNADGTFSSKFIIRDEINRNILSYLLPRYSLESVYYSLGYGRDINMERDQKISPIYHQARCSLEEAYGDESLAGDVTVIAINYGDKPTLHITSSTIGYVPAQWGKIVRNVSMEDFKKTIQTAKAYNSTAKVEMLTISGYQVKHIGPITYNRTCQRVGLERVTYDMYQAIKNGAVITFSVENKAEDGDTHKITIEKEIKQVLETLTVTKY